MQKCNSGFPLLCNAWGNNVWWELLCLSCRSFPLYCHSRPFYSLSFLCFLACVFLPVSLSFFVSMHQCLVASLCWVDAIQRANVTQRERSVSSFSFSLLSPSLSSLHFDFQSHVSLSTAMDSVSNFIGLSEMYKRWGSLLSVLLCLFSCGKCHIFTLLRAPLLQTWSSFPFIFSPFPSLSRFSLTFTPVVAFHSLPPTAVFFTIHRFGFLMPHKGEKNARLLFLKRCVHE